MDVLTRNCIYGCIHSTVVQNLNESAIYFCQKLFWKYIFVFIIYVFHLFLTKTSSFWHSLVRRCIFVTNTNIHFRIHSILNKFWFFLGKHICDKIGDKHARSIIRRQTYNTSTTLYAIARFFYNISWWASLGGSPSTSGVI